MGQTFTMQLDGLLLKHVMWVMDMEYFFIRGRILHSMEEQRFWAEVALVQIPALALAKCLSFLCLSPHDYTVGTLLIISQGCYEDLMS